MYRKFVALAVGALSFGVVQVASAADMPLKAPAAIPYSWTGLYAGVHVGAGFGHVESDIAGFPISSHEINGPLAGGQIGYNYQLNNWAVIGAEGTFSWANIKGSTPCIVVLTCSTKTDWLGTAAVRFGGIVGGNTLVFVKGGGAWAHDMSDASVLGVSLASGSATRTGWLGGVGTEYKFDSRWSGVIEYDYIDFGTSSVSLGGLPVNINHVQHLVKAAINYKIY